ADTLGRLSAALAVGLVEEVPGAVGRFRFAHALIREALYTDLLPSARVELHHRIAHTLETQHAGSADPPFAALAHHFFHAAAIRDDDKAVVYAERAAERAIEQLAYEEGVAHYERAIQALALRPPDEGKRLALRLALGYARWRANDDVGARDTFRRAAE